MAESSYDNESIREGFLCPVCHKDLRSPKNLLSHFENQHSEEQYLLRSIKDLVGKAKKKILKLDEEDLQDYKEEIKEQYYLYSPVQSVGQSRAHTEYFKTVRRERLDHRTSETNKLIIRLDRLLMLWYHGSDRKQHEQELVTWLDGTTVTRCPSCAASFNITRRQHHCRLCGSIMCNSCSYFLPFKIAQTLVAPVHNKESQNREVSTKAESETLRICFHCEDMLEYRRRIQIDQMVQPIICQLYSHLQKLKSQIQANADQYTKMHNSLISGETTFQLHEAQMLRSSIAKQAETMDTLSKKIASLPVNEENLKSATLQTNIRRATSHYIKDNLLTLPALPSAAELEEIRKNRSMRRETPQEVPKDAVKVKRVAVVTGWSPANVPKQGGSEEVEDPLLEQINNVRNYIEQARLAGRFDEAVSLTENLEELKRMQRIKMRENSLANL